MKRLISLVLCLLMMINIFPVKAFAEEQSLEEIIRPQVEAFAKSIDQKNANGKATDTLIGHGIGGGGKKLSVGASHALTATIVNSELIKEFLTDLCAESIRIKDEIETDEIYSLDSLKYSFDGSHVYKYLIYSYNAKYQGSWNNQSTPKDYIKDTSYILVKKSNDYDKSLELIIGLMAGDIDLKVNKVYEDRIVYDVSALFFDVFDFSAENGSALENLLGFIGLLLFKPFEWDSTFSFQIEIPIEKPEENIVFGDMDGSGKVDVSDAYFVRLVAAKLVEPTAEQLAFCDVDGDGKITAIDANIIRKFAAGIIKSLPIS